MLLPVPPINNNRKVIAELSIQVFSDGSAVTTGPLDPASVVNFQHILAGACLKEREKRMRAQPGIFVPTGLAPKNGG